MGTVEYYALSGREMVLRTDGRALSASDFDALSAVCAVTEWFDEDSNNIAVMGIDRDTCVLPDGYEWVTIRQQFAERGVEGCFKLSRAKALLEWRQNTRYCGRCGQPLFDHETLTARQCPKCGNLIFPRIEPCVIVVVSRQDGKILLAKHVQRNQEIYACIAGFMEAGETAEQAVRREVFEETGLTITNVRYYGSQSWPFPSQLMLGFTAEYVSGDLHLQADEIADARWFDRDDCPASPPPGSIAYRLIHNC